jgi:hypothetical protein
MMTRARRNNDTQVGEKEEREERDLMWIGDFVCKFKI